MKKIISKGNLLRTLLFIGTVAIIYLFLPSSDTFKYSYSLGKPWNYSLLTAPRGTSENSQSVPCARSPAGEWRARLIPGGNI